MPALCLMLSATYYAQNYAGIIGASLPKSHSENNAINAPNDSDQEDNESADERYSRCYRGPMDSVVDEPIIDDTTDIIYTLCC